MPCYAEAVGRAQVFGSCQPGPQRICLRQRRTRAALAKRLHSPHSPRQSRPRHQARRPRLPHAAVLLHLQPTLRPESQAPAVPRRAARAHRRARARRRVPLHRTPAPRHRIGAGCRRTRRAAHRRRRRRRHAQRGGLRRRGHCRGAGAHPVRLGQRPRPPPRGARFAGARPWHRTRRPHPCHRHRHRRRPPVLQRHGDRLRRRPSRGTLRPGRR